MLSKNDLNELYKYAIALTHDESSAFDLLHTAVVKSMDKAPVNRIAYLKTSIRNLFYDQLRKARGKETVEFDEEVVSFNSKSLDDLVIDKIDLDNLLEKIDPLDREILFLHAVEDLSFEEIAERMNIKKGTLLSRMHRLRQKIKKSETNHDVV